MIVGECQQIGRDGGLKCFLEAREVEGTRLEVASNGIGGGRRLDRVEGSTIVFWRVILVSSRRLSSLSQAKCFQMWPQGHMLDAKSYLLAGSWYFRLCARFHGSLNCSSCSVVGPGTVNDDSASMS